MAGLNEKCPTAEELRRYLMDDNSWTQEEWDQFSGYYFRHINPDGTTTLSRDEWSILAMGF